MSGPLLSLNTFATPNNHITPFGAKKSTKPLQLSNRTAPIDPNGKLRTNSSNASSTKSSSRPKQGPKSTEKSAKTLRRPQSLKNVEMNKKQPQSQGIKLGKQQKQPQSNSRRSAKAAAGINNHKSSNLGMFDASMAGNEDTDSLMNDFDEPPPPKRIPKKGPEPLQQYTALELSATGLLFEDPGAFGFMKKQQPSEPRPYPKYMLIQPRLLKCPPHHQNDWDRQNQAKMLQMEELNNGSDFQGLYEDFQKMRSVERSKMEELGLVDAENTTKDLNDAIFFQGTCTDMCPTFERVRRALENNVKALEKDFASQKISRSRAVKAFSRPAAGQPPPMPSDVRPPHILQQTLDYLIGTILPQLPDSHSFLWDRTRSIRQDFVYQNYYGPEAIDCNEKIVRIHLLCMHIMSIADVEFSHQQEMEQFNKALQTLIEIYQDVRNHGGSCPNEAEFRAYHLLSHFRDPELEREIQTLPDAIFKDSRVQLALQFRLLMSQNNIIERGHTNKIGAANMFVRFFELAIDPETPILMSCLLETHFNEIRFYALKSLSRSYHTGGKAIQGSSLQQMLGFDSLDDLIGFVSYYEVEYFYEEGVLLIDLCNKEKLETVYKLKSLTEKPKRSPAVSQNLDTRLRERPLKLYVDAGHPNDNLQLVESASSSIIKGKFANMNFAIPQSAQSTNTAFANSQNNFPNASFGQHNQGQSSGFGAQPFSTQKPTSFNLADFALSGTSTQSIPKSAFGQKLDHIAPFGEPKIESTTSQISSAFGQPNGTVVANSHPGAAFNFGAGGNSGGHSKAQGSSTNVPLVPPIDTRSSKSQLQDHKPIESILEKEKDINKSSNAKRFGQSTEITVEFKSNSFTVPKKQEEPQSSRPLEQSVELPQLYSNPSKVTPPISFTGVKPKPISFAEKEKPQTLLKDSVHFERGISSVFELMLGSAIDEELRQTISRVNKAELRKQEKNRVLDLFANELFLAFMAEITYQSTLEVLAERTYQKSLQNRVFSKVASVCRARSAKRMEKQGRLKELESIDFKVPLAKRSRQVSPLPKDNDSFSKRRRTSVVSSANTDEIHKRQDEIKSLWEPLDLKRFVGQCSANFERSNNTSNLECLLVAENWALACSKWLASKFSLKVNDTKSCYLNKVQQSELTIGFQSLSKKTLLNSSFIENTTFIVYECGLVDEGQLSTYKDLATKLNRDRGVLDKIIQICNRYCLFKIQIVIVMWDASQSGCSDEKISKMLSLDRHLHSTSCVQNIEICNMAGENESVGVVLGEKLNTVSERFKGLPTARGQRHMQRQSVAPSDPEPVQRDISIVNENLQSKERELLRKVKESANHGYLNRHVGRNTSVDLTNTSAMFKTPNASFANRSVAQHNKSILGNNSLSFLGRDASFFKSFANGTILEESTPATSPGPEPVNLPKKIQDLRQLTASIKQRYKKTAN
ncbi:hypothetical protein PUMCH_003378 [Australozyma saopauloensis]|uniref:Nuclear mRNA export factor n=1 Tax=Australozyma saopauloensis TaxID=291208 RepID=A0AAX4HBS5_9ASCO|nr:hypothetical protein PUMCH_003378 [[Candida] saopauloensis]